jgi:hypothetical protein
MIYMQSLSHINQYVNCNATTLHSEDRTKEDKKYPVVYLQKRIIQ